MRRLLRSLAALAALVAPFAAATVSAAPVEVGPTISYEEIGSWDAAKLNAILSKSAPETFGVSATYAPATNGVTLYRVTYGSVIPERGNRPITATGLLAVPDVEGETLPLVSYQHGTVYGKEDVPSFPDNSSETQLMIAAFAGRGYALIGADYFGMGGSAKEPEGYGVKASHQQATFDMLAASRAVLASKGIGADTLFLGGWSQGGYVTMCFLERLEKAGVAVTAASTASGPADLYSFLSGFLDFPRENDASWISILYVLSSFSFEEYYGQPGLARSLFTDETYETARKIYTRQGADISALPDLKKLIRADYFDPTFFAESAYGRIAKQSDAYRWIIKTPLRSYYGEADEVVSVGLATLAAHYQQGIGGGNDKVVAISTGKTDHRGTFATAVAKWQTWFDELK